MKKVHVHAEQRIGRRRFLAWLGGLGAAGATFPVLPREGRPRELSLREADFYRPHELAG
jgi:hypothetical protein